MEVLSAATVFGCGICVGIGASLAALNRARRRVISRRNFGNPFDAGWGRY